VEIEWTDPRVYSNVEPAVRRRDAAVVGTTI
jgi:hypothetical protein